MWRWILALAGLAVLVHVVGCGRWMGESNADLQRQKLSLEVMHAERQELTSLIDAEKKTRADNQQSLQELERRRVELQTMGQTVEKERRHLDVELAQANEKLAVAEKRLNAKVQELKALEGRNQQQLDEIAAGKRDITAAFAAMGSGLGSAAKTQKAEPAPQKKAAEMKAARQQRTRRQYLEALADATIAVVRRNPVSAAYGNPQLARKQLLERLQAVKPGDSERQFQEDANRAAEEFANKSAKGTLTEAEIAEIRDFISPQANHQTSSMH
jgi:hypothetical protein